MTAFTQGDATKLASTLMALDAARSRVAELLHEAMRLERLALAGEGSPGEIFWPSRYGMLVRAAGRPRRASVDTAAIDREYEGLPDEVKALVAQEEVATIKTGRLPHDVAEAVRFFADKIEVRKSYPTLAELGKLLANPTPFRHDPEVPDRILIRLPDGAEVDVNGREGPKGVKATKTPAARTWVPREPDALPSPLGGDGRASRPGSSLHSKQGRES